jgi:hypothetical protein
MERIILENAVQQLKTWSENTLKEESDKERVLDG